MANDDAAGAAAATMFLAWAPLLSAILATWITAALLARAVLSRWHMAQPNEWLLLIQNGNLVKSGIGMTCFCPFGASVVRFPSTMQETVFTASQATKQRAGVSVTGKAYWSIYRPNDQDAEGPFRAFKSLTGLGEGDFTAGNEKVQTLATSTIRDAVSNMTITEVMTQREELKERVRKDITPIFRGWGMWLETVEILDVRVESRALFDDMQYLTTEQLNFDTKADAHLAAEKAQMQVKETLDTDRLSSNLSLAKQRADASSEQGIYESVQQLKREEGEARLEQARHELKIASMEKQLDLKLRAAADAASIENKQLEQSLAVAKAQEDAELERSRRKYELEKTLSPINLQKEMIEATKQIYASLPLRDVKLVSLGGASGGSGNSNGGALSTLLPQVAEALNAVVDTGQAGGSLRNGTH